MLHQPYSRAFEVRHSHPAQEPIAPSGRLRRRVLRAVHGEQNTSSTPSGEQGYPRRVLASKGLVAAVAGISAFVLGHSLANHSQTATAGAKTTRAVVHRVGSHAELVVSGMPEPPIGEVYEVWLNHASGPPQPTDALFTVTRTGDGDVDVPGPLRGVRGVTVTSEPLGGSSSPTGAPVLQLPLDS